MASLQDLTTVAIVEAIEPALPSYEALGYQVVDRVPDSGTLGFVILKGNAGQLMLQTRASLAEDLPEIAPRKPSALLYGHVRSLDASKRALPDAKVLIAQRKTFYGATEAWLELPDGTFLGLAEQRE
jgi:hypothetical protein